MPRQTGQTLLFGAAPKALAHPHHIFDLVLSWTCVSNPMTASYSIYVNSLRFSDTEQRCCSAWENVFDSRWQAANYGQARLLPGKHREVPRHVNDRNEPERRSHSDRSERTSCKSERSFQIPLAFRRISTRILESKRGRFEASQTARVRTSSGGNFSMAASIS